MASLHVILVGHCTPDAAMLRSAVSRVVPDVRFTSVNHERELEQHRSRGVLWLVNRALDGRFESEDGVAIIAQAASGSHAPTCLLVSNFPEAQAAAMEAGALRGFGKSALYADATVAAIRDAASACVA